MKELLDLFMAFARIGAFTFGGGYAMLPMLQKEVVEKYHWATEDEIMDYFAIGQCTPGIIAVNTSTFVGYKTHGILGGIAATLGIITPSLIIITIIAAFLQNFADLAVVKYAFNGIRACVCVLIFNAVSKLAKKSVVDKICLGICIVVLLLSLFSPLSPALIVVLAGIAGVVFRRTGIAGGEKK
ncbi:MAG: chromate transporter [Clostridia bacterium]|nr:chromate transporter [Lachnospiraceae bacterium]NCB99402.1 chromate transporter [Clostridia bacterium]NCD01495.1 chromate transporter [Clostridia bacterium]